MAFLFALIIFGAAFAVLRGWNASPAWAKLTRLGGMIVVGTLAAGSFLMVVASIITGQLATGTVVSFIIGGGMAVYGVLSALHYWPNSANLMGNRQYAVASVVVAVFGVVIFSAALGIGIFAFALAHALQILLAVGIAAMAIWWAAAGAGVKKGWNNRPLPLLIGLGLFIALLISSTVSFFGWNPVATWNGHVIGQWVLLLPFAVALVVLVGLAIVSWFGGITLAFIAGAVIVTGGAYALLAAGYHWVPGLSLAFLGFFGLIGFWAVIAVLFVVALAIAAFFWWPKGWVAGVLVLVVGLILWFGTFGSLVNLAQLQLINQPAVTQSAPQTGQNNSGSKGSSAGSNNNGSQQKPIVQTSNPTCTQRDLAPLLNCEGLTNISVVPDIYGTVGFVGEMPAGSSLKDPIKVPAGYYVSITNVSRTIADQFRANETLPQTTVSYIRVYSLFSLKGAAGWCGWFAQITVGESSVHPHGCAYSSKVVTFGLSVKALGFHGDTHLMTYNGQHVWGQQLPAGMASSVPAGAHYSIVVSYNHGVDTHTIVAGHSYIVPASATVYVVPVS